jgi:hypothetical protein
VKGAKKETAMATESCFPEWTSLDVIETFNPKVPHSFSYRLKSTNTGGVFLTHATLEGRFDDQKLNLGFRFEIDGVSLPYNIYAVLVASASRVLGWFDLTSGCNGPGGSIFPRGKLDLPAVKFESAELLDVHIIVWGRL